MYLIWWNNKFILLVSRDTQIKVSNKTAQLLLSMFDIEPKNRDNIIYLY